MSDDESEQVEPEPWIKIQRDTFSNWVNDKLRVVDESVTDVKTDLSDGVRLCQLVEVLQDRNIGRIIRKKKMNHYEASGNIALALQALHKDGVRLVNIGAEDIACSNLKLILGLIWILVRKYQIGSASRLPPKKLMLAWVNAVLHPHLEVANFSTDWNDGRALQGVIEYCKNGSFPNWQNSKSGDRVSNCKAAMDKGQALFAIPLVVSPENFADYNLDELSGMTYMSYFMQVGSPGYAATRKWANYAIGGKGVRNFRTDWNSGYAISALVTAMGGAVPGWPNIDTSNGLGSCQRAMFLSKTLGVPQVIEAKDMANCEVDHIGVMAYVAWHEALAETITPSTAVAVVSPTPPVLTSPPPPAPPPTVKTAPPTAAAPPPAVPHPSVDVSWPPAILANRSSTILVSTKSVGGGVMSAVSANIAGDHRELLVNRVDQHTHHAIFHPDSIGTWQLSICYDGQLTAGSPHSVSVYDVTKARIICTSPGPTQPRQAYHFKVDVSAVNNNDVHVVVTNEERVSACNVMQSGNGQYDVSFTPSVRGLYTVQLFCGGAIIPGSPFTVEVIESLVDDVHAKGDGLISGIKGKRQTFDIINSNAEKDVYIRILSPSQHEVLGDVEKRSDRHVITYTPQESGAHEVHMSVDGVAIAGSPFTANIRSPRVHVNNMRSLAFKNEELKFNVDASEYARGTIELDSNLPVRKYERVGERRYEVTIIPMNTGLHDIAIKMDSVEIAGSPFTVQVAEKGPGGGGR